MATVKITSVFAEARVDFEALKSKAKRKIFESKKQMATYIYRDVRRAIRTSSNKNQTQTNQLKVWTPKGEELSGTPTQYVKDKRIVAAGMGRGGRTAIQPEDTGEYRWNKVSKPGERPITHPANQPGWMDHWLKEMVRYDITGPDIHIFVNPYPNAKKSGNTKLLPRIFETGGSYTWERKKLVGYDISTISHGTNVSRGDGEEIAGKKDTHGAKGFHQSFYYDKKTGKPISYSWSFLREQKKNRSGRTQRDHFRKYEKPRVSFRKRYTAIGNKGQSMAARPFLGPAVDAFLQKHFNETFDNLLNK